MTEKNDPAAFHIPADEHRKLAESAHRLFEMLNASVATTALVTGSEPDYKQALEIGMSVLLDKPIVVLAPEDQPISGALMRAATKVIRYRGDGPLEAEVGEQMRDFVTSIVADREAIS